MSDFRSPWEEFAPYIARAGETIANAVRLQQQQEVEMQNNLIESLSWDFERIKTDLRNIDPSDLARLNNDILNSRAEILNLTPDQYTPDMLRLANEISTGINQTIGAAPSMGLPGQISGTAAAILGLGGESSFSQSDLTAMRNYVGQNPELAQALQGALLLGQRYQQDPTSVTPEELQFALNVITQVSTAVGAADANENLTPTARSLLTSINSDQYLLNPNITNAQRNILTNASEVFTRFLANDPSVSVEQFLGAQQNVFNVGSQLGVTDANVANAQSTYDIVVNGWTDTTSSTKKNADIAALESSGIFKLLGPDAYRNALTLAGIEDPNAINFEAAQQAQRVFDNGAWSLLSDENVRVAFADLMGVDPTDSAAFTAAVNEHKGVLENRRRLESQQLVRDLVTTQLETTSEAMTYLSNTYTGDQIRALITNRDALPANLPLSEDYLSNADLERAAFLADARIRRERIEDPMAQAAFSSLDQLFEAQPGTQEEVDQLIRQASDTLQTAGFDTDSVVYMNYMNSLAQSFDSSLSEAERDAAQAALELALIQQGLITAGDAGGLQTLTNQFEAAINAIEKKRESYGCVTIVSFNTYAVNSQKANDPVCLSYAAEINSYADKIANTSDLAFEAANIQNYFAELPDGSRPVNINGLTGREINALIDLARNSTIQDTGEMLNRLNVTAEAFRNGSIAVDDSGVLIEPGSGMRLDQLSEPGSVMTRDARGDGGLAVAAEALEVRTNELFNDPRFRELLDAQNQLSMDVTFDNPMEDKFAEALSASGVPADEFNRDLNVVLAIPNGASTAQDRQTMRLMLEKYGIPVPAEGSEQDYAQVMFGMFLNHFGLDMAGNVAIPKDVTSNRNQAANARERAEATVSRLTRTLVNEYNQSAFTRAMERATSQGLPEVSEPEDSSLQVLFPSEGAATDVFLAPEGAVGQNPNILGSYGALRNVSPVVQDVIGSLIIQESSGEHVNPVTGELTQSVAGALGITQLMPETAYQPGFDTDPLFDLSAADRAEVNRLRNQRAALPAGSLDRDFITSSINAILRPYMENASEQDYIQFGAQYLDGLLTYYNGNLSLALAAYNAGPGRVDQALQDAGLSATDADAGRNPSWMRNLVELVGNEPADYVNKVLGRLGY